MEQAKFWVGVAFAAVFVLFLMYSINKGKELNHGQRLMLRILSSLCGAIGGALISGEALVNYSGTVPGGKMTISGTAGFAILFVIWITFPKGPKFEPLPAKFKISVPAKWAFEQVADLCAQLDNSVIDYNGFSDMERKAELKEWRLETDNVVQALEALGSITIVPNSVRKYRVKKAESRYELRII